MHLVSCLATITHLTGFIGLPSYRVFLDSNFPKVHLISGVKVVYI